MAQNFLSCDRDQELLLPPSLREWLPSDHLAWFVIECVEELDLSAIYADYRDDGWGRAAHDPGMMVALLLYAYARGERSSRLIERRCVEDVAYRVIAAGQAPDHATVARFRVRHEGALGELFGQVLALCAKAGLLRSGTLALDSTKLEANASGLANMSYEQIAQAILEEAAEVDAREDELYGERRGDELPAELRDSRSRREWLARAKQELEREQAARPPAGSRPARLAEAKRRLEEEHALERQAVLAYEAGRARRERDAAAAGRRPLGRPRSKELVVPEKPTGRINPTDPDSRPVRTARGFIQGYNAQAVATEDQIVVCAEVTIGSPDQGLLEPLVVKARSELEAIGANPPTTLLADAGYWNTGQLADLRAGGIDVLVPPDGESRRGPPKRHPLAAALRARLETEEGSALYRKRQLIIEPIFGQTKANRRIDRFLRRGLAACRAEWRLITATHNLLKLHRHSLQAAGA